ncbi:LUD domain-containing protein [Spirillospora sp. NPDC047279]|uniref:lactate utilization protein B n=1 Tax=Spirillospora sp. NPDC047279 TaxID=3155478 RepID=UPI0033CC8B9D
MTPVPLGMPKFAAGAKAALSDTGQRRNLRTATGALRDRSAAAARDAPDWDDLREAGAAIRDQALLNLDGLLEELERAVTEAGGTVHWAVDAAEAGDIVTRLVRETGEGEVVTAGSALTREIGLDEALGAAGATARETEIGELVVRLGPDGASHLTSPAAHRNRAQIRDLFLNGLPGAGPGLSDDPEALAAAARTHLRHRLLTARVAVFGADFAVAETGTLVALETEGGRRMSLALAGTLICVAGIESVVPTWQDLEVLLQLVPRSSAGDPMSPSVSAWTGVTPGDGPHALHLVLLDNGRSAALADEVGRTALRCVRCAACLNVCPVYERAGGGPYGPVLPGPIGAILTPQFRGVEGAYEASLPYASTLCGACADVCPVKIDIPDVLIHLRGKVVESRRRRPVPNPEMLLMRTVAWTMGDRRRYEASLLRSTRWARLLSRGGRIRRLPGLLGKWTDARDLPTPPAQSFRAWWRDRPPRRFR